MGVFVGAVTFSGSIVAFGKLRGLIGSRPLLLPGRHVLNMLALTVVVAWGSYSCADVPWSCGRGADRGGHAGTAGHDGPALLLGIHLVVAIGGGDMPVVVSLLNSYSGWAAAAAGFMLSNDLLIITGALVGSSGAILSYIMCQAMNRSIWNVIFGGFGASAGAKPAAGAERRRARSPRRASTRWRICCWAPRASIIVPGTAWRSRRRSTPVKEISSLLIEKGRQGRYAIHPVAGRLPGHMNVLLAEANVSYDIVKEMDEINEDFPKTDVVHGHRRQRHRESERADRSVEPDLRHAGAGGLEGGARW